MSKHGNQLAFAVEGLIEEGEAFRRLAVERAPRCFDVIVIGGGQSGLSVGYHLQKLGLSFVILDASARIGDVWRKRWDTLRLFTPARYDGLDGWPFPGPPDAFPTKDEMADYLESYAEHFQLPVRSDTRVTRLSREGERYRVEAGAERFEAEHVVVAMASYQAPNVPNFAKELSPGIVQLHSSEYRGLSQLQPGAVLVVGAANSGAEIAIETVRRHRTLLSGRDPGELPFSIGGFWSRLIAPLLFRVVFPHILSIKTPMGRRARTKMLRSGAPRIRQRRTDLEQAGVEWAARTSSAKAGVPLLADGRTVEVRNVIWCTGYSSGLSWIELPIFDDDGEPRHVSGLVENEPGLYFVGQHFQHSLSSTMIHGVGRDAVRMVQALHARLLGRLTLEDETLELAPNEASKRG